MNTRDFLELTGAIINILVGITVIGTAIWAIVKVKQYRELKHRIQFDLEANIYKLSRPENTASYTWDRQGNRLETPMQPHTHAVEIALKFKNIGFTRFKIFNIQVGLNTMRPPDEAKFDENNGHLHLTRIYTSGNVVEIMSTKDKPIEKTSFYYIEPGIEQTITYLALIPEPRELLQIFAHFSLEQERIFPKQYRGPMGLFPHTVVRTFQLNSEGLPVTEVKF